MEVSQYLADETKKIVFVPFALNLVDRFCLLSSHFLSQLVVVLDNDWLGPLYNYHHVVSHFITLFLVTISLNVGNDMTP